MREAETRSQNARSQNFWFPDSGFWFLRAVARLRRGGADRWRRLCELNVAEQVRMVARVPSVREAWQRGQPLVVHGWIYDLRDGLLRDLEVSISGLAA